MCSAPSAAAAALLLPGCADVPGKVYQGFTAVWRALRQLFSEKLWSVTLVLIVMWVSAVRRGVVLGRPACVGGVGTLRPMWVTAPTTNQPSKTYEEACTYLFTSYV